MALSWSLLAAVPVAAQQADQSLQTATPQASTAPASDLGTPDGNTLQGDQAGTSAVADQDTPPAGRSADIVVTGSRVSRPNITSAAPVTTVTAEDIKQTGAINVEDVLRRLPQVTPDNSQNNPGGNGTQGVNLRRLGVNRTLNLINGQRLGTTTGLDVNVIPVALLKRIDVLSGGASAVYGSDAVAGVVNFIIDEDFQGVQASGNYSLYQHDNRDSIVGPVARASGYPVAGGNSFDGGRADLSLAIGHHFFDDKLKLSGFVDYRHADPVQYSDRDFSACRAILSAAGGASCDVASYSRYGWFQPGAGANAGTIFANDKSGSAAFVPYDNSYGSNQFGNYYAQRQDERINGGAFATLTLDKAAELYGSYLISSDKSSNLYNGARIGSYTSYGSTPYQVNCNNPLLSAQQIGTICGAAAGTGALAPLDLHYQFDNAALNRTDRYNNLDQRFAGGIRGDFADAWHYDLGGVYSKFRRSQVLGLPNADYTKVNNSLNVVDVNGVPTCASVVNGTDPSCVPADIFSSTGGSAAYANYLFSGFPGRQTLTAYLYDVTFNVTGDLGHYGIRSPFAEDGVGVNLGAEYRKDKQVNDPDDAYIRNNGGNYYDNSIGVKELYGEVQVPIAQHKPGFELLSLSGAYRVSKYTSVDKNFTTWKLEGVYSPVSDITFRASWNKAARAPTLYEASPSPWYEGLYTGDICAGATPQASLATCQLTGVTAAQYGNIPQCTDNTCLARGQNEVEPESAHTLTYGLLLKPRFIKGLVFSVDRYQIKIDNSIGYQGEQFWSDGCLTYGTPLYCSHFVRNSDGSLNSYSAYTGSNPTSGYVAFGNGNQYVSKSEGYDFQAQYAFGLPANAGRVNVDFNGSLATNISGADSPDTPFRNCVGYFGLTCGAPTPKWTHYLRLTYTTPDRLFSLSGGWRHISGTLFAGNSGDPTLGASNTTVLTSFYRVPTYDYADLQATVAIAKNLELRFTVNNLFDREPPILANASNYVSSYSNSFPTYYDTLGREFQIGFTTRF